MPKELVGMHSRDAKGDPICFGFNLASGYKDAAAGAKCRRGRHVCCTPGCYGSHARQSCTHV